MNENDLKQLWQKSNEKLEVVLRENKINTEDITKLKIQNLLSSMKPIKAFTLIIGLIWVIGLGSYLSVLTVFHFEKVSIFFLFSAITQVLLTAVAIVMYIYQIHLINKIDFSEPVLTMQKKVSELKISTLNVTRLLFLQLPLWTTFYLNEKMFVVENWILLILQFVISISFTFVAVWLFFNIKHENQNSKWFQFIFSGKEWQPILHSAEILYQIEQFDKYE